MGYGRLSHVACLELWSLPNDGAPVAGQARMESQRRQIKSNLVRAPGVLLYDIKHFADLTDCYWIHLTLCWLLSPTQSRVRRAEQDLNDRQPE